MVRIKAIRLTIIIFTIFLLFGSFTISASAHTAKIETGGENKYKAIRITPQIYNAANSSLSDLLVKGNGGENIPYFINSGTKDVAWSREEYAMSLVNSYLMDNSFYFDYKRATERSGDTISTSVEFTTNNVNFAKEVEVYGSYDNINWDYIQNDILYAIDNKAKLSIEFHKPQKFTHIRLRLANNLEQISFGNVALVYVVEISEETYFIESIEPGFSVVSEDRSTDIIIEGLKNLRLCDITIHTGSMFQRYARMPHGASKEIFNLTLNGTSYADTTIPLNWHISSDDTFIVTIADADDKPIIVDGVSVRYYADEVVFEGAEGGAYTLEFNGDPSIAAPVYDIERYKAEILKGAIDIAAIGDISISAAMEEPRLERDYRRLFNIIIVVVALLLGAIIIFKLKKNVAGHA